MGFPSLLILAFLLHYIMNYDMCTCTCNLTFMNFCLQEFPEYERVIGFHMETHDASKRLWRTCIEHHAFFRMTEIKKSPQRGSPFRRSRARITYVCLSVCLFIC